MNVSLAITGLDALAQRFDPARLRAELSKTVDDSAQLLRDDTKRMPPVSAATTGYAAVGIPVDTGRLRQSIQYRKTGELEAVVSADVQYSIFVQDGTSRMPARPFFRFALETGTQKKIIELFRGALRRLYN